MAGEVTLTEEQKACDAACGGGSRRKLMPLRGLDRVKVHAVYEHVEELLKRVEVSKAHGITPVRLNHPFATGHLKLLVA